MIALWMTYATLVALVLGVAALAIDRVADGAVGRRWCWAVALAASLAIPAWRLTSPDLARAATRELVGRAPRDASGDGPARGGAAFAAELVALLERARPQTGALARLDRPLIVAWGLAAALLLSGYSLAVHALARRRRRWREDTLDGHAVLIAPAAGPAVVGALRPRIVLPEWSLELPVPQRRLMLAHEREHVHARDPLLLHLATLAVLVTPWNLAAWWLLRRLRLAVEMDCDARVLGAGRDVRTYGTLLLNVCARRARGVPLLAPALLERTSTLSRRILAMHPRRPRHPRTRAALSAAAALALVALACEAPSPELLAPDGRDVAAHRLYGGAAASEARAGAEELRALIGRHFPEVARGAGGPTILFFVRDADGRVVLTERAPADGSFLRTPRRGGADQARATTAADTIRPEALPEATEPRVRVRSVERVPADPAPARRSGPSASGATVRELPRADGIGALATGEIASVDVSKHSAGKLAPNAVSVVSIQLKPGARVPPPSRGG